MSDNQIVFKDCYTGKDFELRVVDFLRGVGFKADKTGRNDGGIDIVATKEIEGTEYKFYIQCKYFNTTLSKHPIQEVFAGANYYAETSGKGTPVVITNNRITREARIYAKRLGVEVIGDGEWKELSQVTKTGQLLNPNIHHGLFGMIIATALEVAGNDGAADYLHSALEPPAPEDIADKEELVLKIQSEFDQAEEYIKESARLYQRATQNQQKAMTIHRDAIIQHIRHT